MEPLKRVLVVDDDAEIRGLLSTTFRHYGLTVDVASDGREALECIAGAQYAVIVLDLIMPSVDGFTVIERLGARDEALPVVLVITGAEEHVGALDARVVHGVIRKPVDPEELAHIVLACAEIRGRGAFETMAIAAMVAGTPLMAWLTRLQ